MTTEIMITMLQLAHKAYGSRFTFADAADIASTAQAWVFLFGDITDDEGKAAFVKHCTTSEFPPTPAAVIAAVRYERREAPQFCTSCGAMIAAGTGGMDDDGQRLCEDCYVTDRGGPCPKALSEGLRDGLLKALPS